MFDECVILEERAVDQKGKRSEQKMGTGRNNQSSAPGA